MRLDEILQLASSGYPVPMHAVNRVRLRHVSTRRGVLMYINGV